MAKKKTPKKRTKVLKRHKEQATTLLNKMIEWTEAAGQLSGKRGKKRLTFSDILVNFETRQVYPFLIEDFSYYLAEKEVALLAAIAKRKTKKA